MDDAKTQAFLPFRLVAEYADGQRITFDGLTEQQARQAMEAAQNRHGGLVWWDGVTDTHYTAGCYCKTLPHGRSVTIIDLTDD